MRILRIGECRTGRHHYPITNTRFQAFVDAEDGYGNNKWWTDLARVESPELPSWSEGNHPRETISWYEAVAFCRWFTQKYHEHGMLDEVKAIRLPTEWEWRQAATGGDPKNVYPWGSKWDAARYNSTESSLSQTTAIGIYPNGSTPQGLLDMAGNVWEWCLNKYDDPNDIRIDQSGGQRVLRGGSWGRIPERLCSAARNGFNPADRWSGHVGFRLRNAKEIS